MNFSIDYEKESNGNSRSNCRCRYSKNQIVHKHMQDDSLEYKDYGPLVLVPLSMLNDKLLFKNFSDSSNPVENDNAFGNNFTQSNVVPDIQVSRSQRINTDKNFEKIKAKRNLPGKIRQKYSSLCNCMNPLNKSHNNQESNGVEVETITELNNSSCKVCGDLASDHSHYGGTSCYSCRIFFKRSVGLNRR